MTNVISLEDAFAHLEDRISDAANCKKIIIDLMGWILRWNTDRLEGNQVFSFLREFQNGNRSQRVNVAFALHRDGNQIKENKPNFFVIKLDNTDREFRGVHCDFDFTGLGLSDPPDELLQYLRLRPSRAQSRRRRWIAECNDISRMGFDNFQQLFLIAYTRKCGVI